MAWCGAVGLAISFVVLSTVNAHGVITQITVEGQQYAGYEPSKAWQQPAPDLAGWSIPEDTDLGPIEPPKYANPDIICHIGATPGKAYVTVAAGSQVNLKWSSWPDSHHGPVLDYLASCPNGDCTTVDKTQLKFIKIAESGLLDDSTPPGFWGADKLLQAGASWTVTIPQCVAPGNYVLRTEIIALHGAFDIDKAQNYPQCINLKVTGSGTRSLASTGEPATQFYKNTDPGIQVGIYNPLPNYVIPGPPLFSCDGSSGGIGGGANSTSSTGSSGSLGMGSSMGSGPSMGMGSSMGSSTSTGMGSMSTGSFGSSMFRRSRFRKS
ncbi:MAG: hypothetical protein Q9222_005889 [Ikaeria aurantiellina]